MELITEPDAGISLPPTGPAIWYVGESDGSPFVTRLDKNGSGMHGLVGPDDERERAIVAALLRHSLKLIESHESD